MKSISIYVTFLLIITSQSHLFSMHALPDYSTEESEKHASLTSLSLHTGFLYGAIGEYVYNGKYKLSELNWDVKPLFYIGNAVNVCLNNGFIAGFGYWSGLNKDMDSMEDIDWNYSGIKTSKSVHDCILMTARFFDAYAGYSFAIKTSHNLSIQLGYKYQQIILEARDGYKDAYAESLPGYTHMKISGVFVQYEQKCNIPYIGMSWRFQFFKRFYSQLFGIYGPYIFCDVIDSHISNNLTFYDSFKGGNYISAGALFGWEINPFCLLSLCGSYTKILRFRGDTYSVETASGTRSMTYNNGAAMSLNAWEMELAFGISIEWSDKGSSE